MKVVALACLPFIALMLCACGSSTEPITSTPEPQAPAAEGPTVGPLISGTTSWVEGTHAWTDYAYDDRGQNAGAAYPGGVYPSAELANAADLIQLQVSVDQDQLHITAVLETLTDVSVPLLGVGLDLDADPSTGAAALPGEAWQVAGTPLGLEQLIVVSSAGTRLLSWSDAQWQESAGPSPAIDSERNTIGVTLPLSSINADRAAWRAVGVVGLATSGQSWLDDGGPILDLAYVRDTSTAQWQSGLQAAVLSGEQDAALAVATISTNDFAQRRNDLAKSIPGQKETFLYKSALRLGEGIQGADRKYAGPYQPYVAWIPENFTARSPLIVFMHGALQNHLTGPYGDPDDSVSHQLNLQAAIVTPLGRGEAFGWYSGASEQDVLNVAADAERRLGTDPDRVVLSGYSLGGVGTFNLSQLYPDRWAGAIEIVGAPDLGVVELLGVAPPLPYTLENLRNLPFRLAHARADELELIVGVVQPAVAALRLQLLGYDYRYWQFYLRDHLTFPVGAVQCEFEAFAANARIINPPRVVYSQEPALRHDEADSGLLLPHDSAYWMSELKPRGDDFRPGEKATVDITSLALPDREPQLEPVAGLTQNILAGRDVCGDNPTLQSNDIWTVIGQAWSGYEPATLSNGLVASLISVESVRLDVQRMGIEAEQHIDVDVTSDGASLLRLAGPWSAGVAVEQDGREVSVVCAANGEVSLPVATGTSSFKLRPVANCR